MVHSTSVAVCMSTGYCLCRSCERILAPNENCADYWYCTTCNYHHEADLVCKISNPHRWYCPHQDCRTAYNVGTACTHSWYCEGCNVRHALADTCPNGWMYCSNEGCRKILNATESCPHFWACPTCEKTHHAAADTCPNGCWFCIDCFRADPSTGIYAQTDGCPHHWWCADCNDGNGVRYGANDACGHRWGCAEDKTGHTFNEACAGGNWYCTDCEGGTRYDADETTFCDHGWYCSEHQFRHALDDTCEAYWYCGQCEDKIHKVSEEAVCEHAWYCPACELAHLKTDACPENAYRYCSACEEAQAEKCVYAAGENCPHIATGNWYCETCNKDCLTRQACDCDNWYCDTCEQTYTKDQICPCGNWCCEKERIRFASDQSCSHYWHCPTHGKESCNVSSVCENSFACVLCNRPYPIGKGCDHCWFCTACNAKHNYTNTADTTYQEIIPCTNGCWFCRICNLAYTTEQTCEHYYRCVFHGSLHYKGEACSGEMQWNCLNSNIQNLAINQVCYDCGRWYCEICQKIYTNEATCPHYFVHNSYKYAMGDQNWSLWSCPSCRKTFSPGSACEHYWSCDQCGSRMTVGQRDKGNHAWSCALCGRAYANSVLYCDHCWQQNGVVYALDVKNENCWFCELCNQGAGNYQWSDTCEHYRWCHACQKRHRTDEVCPRTWECPLCENRYAFDEVCREDGVWYCDQCHTVCFTNSCDAYHYWCCLNDYRRLSVLQSCPGCNRWFCTICNGTILDDEDANGHQRPDAVNKGLKQSSLRLRSPNPFKAVDQSSKEAFNFDKNPFASDEDEKDTGSVHKPILSLIQKQSDKLSQNANVKERPILRKLQERNERTRQAKANKGICEHPKHKQPSPKQCLHPSNGHVQPFDKKPLGVHVKSRINLRKPSDKKSVKPKVDGQSNFPKAELKRSKPSDADKYPLLTRSHIRYSNTEDLKQPSPTDKQPLPKVEDTKQRKDEALSSKVERPMLQYNLNIDALLNNLKTDPLSISGLSNLGQQAEMRENSRINDLKSQLEQASKVRTASKPTPDGFSGIMPPMSKVIKNGEERKEEQPFSTFGKPTPTQRSSFRSSSSDSDKSETPKGNAKDPKIYTNKPTDNLQKSAFKKTYKEDEGNETPSDSQSDAKFNLLKSSKNKNAAPNASGMKPKLTKLPSASDGSQQIGFKTFEGSKELPKINGQTPKSDDVTPTPKGDTPNGETQKGDTPKSDAKDKKSDGSSSSDEDKKSKRSESRSSHKSQTSKSEKNDASDEDKKSSHSKSSKSSSKKSVKTYSHDSHSEKHSDGEVSKSDKGSDKEGKSSEHNESSEEENSEEEDEASETPEK